MPLLLFIRTIPWLIRAIKCPPRDWQMGPSSTLNRSIFFHGSTHKNCIINRLTNFYGCSFDWLIDLLVKKFFSSFLFFDAAFIAFLLHVGVGISTISSRPASTRAWWRTPRASRTRSGTRGKITVKLSADVSTHSALVYEISWIYV